MQDFMLTDRETRVVLELLEEQEKTLVREIQHCSTRAMKEKLEDQLHVVERLIERFDDVDQPLNA
jgi:predicted house-cleaning noncanonical NTP pyrophosphatase (MazG superfamily)